MGLSLTLDILLIFSKFCRQWSGCCVCQWTLLWCDWQGH